MTTVRTLTLGVLISAFSSLAFGQTKTTTKELASIANTFGVDSALKSFRAFNYSNCIYQTDTVAALSIALQCSDLTNYSRQLNYFTDIGQITKSEALNSKALTNLKSYKLVLSDTTNHEFKKFVVPDEIFHVLVFQNDTSIIPHLIAEFDFWEQTADSIHNNRPSAVTRFFQSFKGFPPSSQLYSDCKENSFKLAWTLNKLQASGFTADKVNAIRQQLVPYLINYDMDRYKYKSYQLRGDTIQLQMSFSSFDDIDNFNDLALGRYTGDFEGEKCWKQIVTNSKQCLYSRGCYSSGEVLGLQLIGQNKLLITILDAWRGH